MSSFQLVLLTFLFPSVALVVPVLPWPARRVSSAPVRPEQSGLGHQGFSQAERGEVWLAVHTALPLICIHSPRTCGLPHFHQWVSGADKHLSLFHLYFFSDMLSVSGFWDVALCLCFPLSSSSSCSGSAQSGGLIDSWTLALGTEVSQKWWEPISERSMQLRCHYPWNGTFREGITSE